MRVCADCALTGHAVFYNKHRDVSMTSDAHAEPELSSVWAKPLKSSLQARPSSRPGKATGTLLQSTIVLNISLHPSSFLLSCVQHRYN